MNFRGTEQSARGLRLRDLHSCVAQHVVLATNTAVMVASCRTPFPSSLELEQALKREDGLLVNSARDLNFCSLHSPLLSQNPSN